MTLGSLWDHFGVALGPLSGQFSIALGSFWIQFGVALVLIKSRFGIIVGPPGRKWLRSWLPLRAQGPDAGSRQACLF